MNGHYRKVLSLIFANHCSLAFVLALSQFISLSVGAVINATWSLNGNGNWNTAANWDIGVVPNNNAIDQFNVRIDNDVNFDVVAALNVTLEINHLTVDMGDELRFLDSHDLVIAGSSIENNGTISLKSTGSDTFLRLQSAVTTLSGDGTLLLGGLTNNRIFGGVATNELINSSTHTIAGGGQLGANLLKLSNQGLIDANIAASILIIDPNAAGVINTSTIRASNGGTLRLKDGTFTNTGGVIRALDLSTIELAGTVNIIGGILSTTGSGAIKMTVNGNILHDVTLNGLLQMNNDIDSILKGTITNNGTVEQNSTGSNTQVQLDGNVTLSGTGMWTMSNNVNNRLFSLVNTQVLTNDTQHTIQGAGQLGGNSMGLNNLGLIDANQTALLTIDPSTTGATNTGILRASNGGTLRLQDGTFTNTGGVIRALDLSTIELAGTATIVGGTLSTSGSGVIKMTFNGNILQDVTLNGLLQMNNDVDSILKGTITNNGTVEQNSTGSNTHVQIDGNVTLSGTGKWTMSNNIGNRIIGLVNTQVLTNDTQHTIQGAGQLGGNSMGLNNLGLIDANQTALLTIDPSTTGATNTGILRASNGGTLRLQDGTFTNTGGLIRALDLSTIELAGTGTIVGGTLSTSGSGVIKMTLNGNILHDVTLNGLLQMNNDVDSILKGTITNNGTVEQNSTGSITQVQIDGNVTLSGTGMWAMSNNIGNRIIGLVNTQVLTNDTQHTIQGAGQLGGNSMGLNNLGLIDANQTAVLTIDPTTSMVNQSTGTLRGSGTGGLQLTGGTFDNQGTVEALNGSNMTYSTSAVTTNNVAGVLTGGTWRSISTGSGSTVTLRGSNIHQIALGTEVELSGIGSVLQVGTTPLESMLTMNAGSLRVANSRTFNTANAFINAGTIDLFDATISSNIGITNTSAGLISGRGQIDGIIINQGTLQGGSSSEFLEINGTVSGDGLMKDVRIDNTHMAGFMDSTAIVPLEGSYLLNGDSVQLKMKLGGTIPGAGHDQLNSTGTVNLDGILDVRFVDLGNSYFPGAGDQFTIISSTSPILGSFDVVNLPVTTGSATVTWLPVNYSNPHEVVLEIESVDFYDADFDIDGDVDSDDLDNWQAGYGTGTMHMDGDADDDGDVDGRDFIIWQRQYTGPGTQTARLAIPEPSVWCLVASACLLSSARCKRFASRKALHAHTELVSFRIPSPS